MLAEEMLRACYKIMPPPSLARQLSKNEFMINLFVVLLMLDTRIVFSRRLLKSSRIHKSTSCGRMKGLGLSEKGRLKQISTKLHGNTSRKKLSKRMLILLKASDAQERTMPEIFLSKPSSNRSSGQETDLPTLGPIKQRMQCI